jgi:MFS family permease
MNYRVPLDFKRLMSARFLFTFAVQMQAVVLGWRMFEITKDPLHLGLIGLAEAVPALGLALFAGAIVDRSRPLLVYQRVLWVSLCSAALFAVSQWASLGLSESAQVIALYASSLLTGTARAFSQPAMYAAAPRLIPRERLQESSAWMTSTLHVARVGGPAAGGLIYAYSGIALTLWLVCFSIVAAIIALHTMRHRVPAPKLSGQNESIAKDFFSGLKFVVRHKVLLPALSLDMVSVLFGGVTALLPIYAAEILFVGPKGLGALRAAPAVGAFVMSVALTRIDLRRHAGSAMLWGVAGFGLTTLVFAVSHSFALSITALALSGAFDAISMVVRAAAVQLCSPDDMRGKISAVNSMFIGSSNELGQLESGIAAKLMGLVPSAVFGGVVCMLTVVVVSAASKTLRSLNLRDLEQSKPTL